jgi:hypothetical protein
MQADNAEAEADKTARAEDRTRWMDGILDEENQMTDSDLWKMLAAVLTLVLIFVGIIGDIPEGYEDEDGFHYGRKENK